MSGIAHLAESEPKHGCKLFKRRRDMNPTIFLTRARPAVADHTRAVEALTVIEGDWRIRTQAEIAYYYSLVEIYIPWWRLRVWLTMKVYSPGKNLSGRSERWRVQENPILLRRKSTDPIYWHAEFKVLAESLA